MRVFRAATELEIKTVAIYSHEDRLSVHRYKADESYCVGKGKSPVGAYLDYNEIVSVAAENGVDAIHPGYGFLSENAHFAQACKEAGIIFVGPKPEVLSSLGDKTAARKLAAKCNVPTVPGTAGAISTLEEAKAFIEACGYPIIIKAAHGGGGRGMRVVRSEKELADALTTAQSEALKAFGDGTVFIERYLEKPRHIEIQILADSHGNVVHLFERDCSIQRRHQKLLEIAPSVNLDRSIRESLYADAIKLAREVGYENAGTVEFLVDPQGRYYFIEVNPRIQVEHTVTEEITGVDLVQSQIKVASGISLPDLGLEQSSLMPRGYAIQCRVTSEDPQNRFQPDHGRIEVFRPGEGMGIRLDSSNGFSGVVITPHYDSLLSKVTGRALTFPDAVKKLRRALAEFRVRGVKTNVPFLQKLLARPELEAGVLHTDFVDQTPELFEFPPVQNRANKLLSYIGDLVVNGVSVAGAMNRPVSRVEPIIPATTSQKPPRGWKQILDEEGPEGFARRVREHKGLLLTDTTWRDAHQSLLATRMRTIDIANIAPATASRLHNFYSLENWGGATFDVALRFLHECPWDRLERLRELVPNVPFQMLLRGANAVGYTAYPDNVVYKFCKQAHDSGMDVFRVFDSLNYLENLKLGIDAAGESGGVIEAAVCYTGDVSDPALKKYDLEYYLNFARQLVKLGIHVLAIKDMAGLLKPQAARILITALRKEFPDIPIHVHTHDTSGTGVASMLAAAESGADVVDVAIEAMSGLTSQPAMGAIAASLQGSPLDTHLDLNSIGELNDYWHAVREQYAPFESGQKSAGSDVYLHEMPGGQYTNLMFQSQSLGLAGQWSAIKRAYAEANLVLGDIVKVTPSSKVVGDLAQFMVQNGLDGQSVVDQADKLDFPQSVIEFLQGYLGEPYQGFPEEFREKALRGKPKIKGRPGASLPPLDFAATKRKLVEKYGNDITDNDVMSSVMYPKVFDEYRTFTAKYADVSVLPTRFFIEPPDVGEEFSFELERGKRLIVKMTAVGELDKSGNREVFFELNGLPRSFKIPDKEAHKTIVQKEKADPSNKGSVGAPMPGSVVSISVAVGDKVNVGDPLFVLSAMKMETTVTSNVSGTVKRITAQIGEEIKAGDLLVEIA